MDRAEITLNTVRWSRTKAANRVKGRATTDGSAVRMSQEWAARSTTPGRPPWNRTGRSPRMLRPTSRPPKIPDESWINQPQPELLGDWTQSVL